jgi:hypothetical protein
MDLCQKISHCKVKYHGKSSVFHDLQAKEKIQDAFHELCVV